MRMLLTLLLPAILAHSVLAREFQVSAKGDDSNDGSLSRPYRTISAAARVAQPGDVITVHEGTYRERITPPRGGESDAKRIVYQAAAGDEVVIKGSEVIRGWKPFRPGVWKVAIPNSFFGAYNPYKDLICGDWFTDKGRPHHTGEVYLNGKSLWETNLLERVLEPRPASDIRDKEGSTWTWFCESDDKFTYLYANFHDKDPNQELVEINVRDSCFYPDQPGRNYMTIRGFRMSQAATQWAPPTAEQIGLIGTHWSKGWIIENNVISDSKCSGITLGKDRKTGHSLCTLGPHKNGDYDAVIARALAMGWSKENIGSHIVRNNTIFNCEQTGIAGSLGGAFSQITNNHIYNIWTKRQFTGAEMGAIKLHGAIDVLIKSNSLHHCSLAVWTDWMGQGTRITGNLCYENSITDLLVEVDHGPFLVDNNLFLSDTSLYDASQGGAYVHNLMTGKILSQLGLTRSAPYLHAHSTALAGQSNTRGGDNRFYNNIFVGDGGAAPTTREPGGQRITGFGLHVYDTREYPLLTGGNVYYNGAHPYSKETNPLLLTGAVPKVGIVEEAGGVYLRLNLDPAIRRAATMRVNTALLGKARIPGLPYENADGTPLIIDRDYFGKPREGAHPYPGPFENVAPGDLKLRVGPAAVIK